MLRCGRKRPHACSAFCRSTAGLAAALIVCAGCSQPDLQTLLSEEGVESESLEPGNLRVAKAAPIVWDEQGAPWGREILKERSFASVVESESNQGGGEEEPAKPAWQFVGKTDMVTLASDADIPEQVKRANPGAAALRMSGEKAFSLIQQTPYIPIANFDVWVAAEVWAKCSMPGGLFLTLNSNNGTPETAIRVVHPGDGEWHPIRIMGPYPWSDQTIPLKFSVEKNPGAAEPILIAAPSLSLRPVSRGLIAQATGDPKEFLINGGFEKDTQSVYPFPWQFNRWGGDSGTARVVESNEAPEGTHVVEMIKPEGGVRFFQRLQTFGPDYAGMTFVATVRSRAKNKADSVLGLRVSGPDNKPIKELSNAVGHPGDGEWHEMRLENTLPENAEQFPITILFDIYRRGFDDEPVLFDQASFRMK